MIKNIIIGAVISVLIAATTYGICYNLRESKESSVSFARTDTLRIDTLKQEAVPQRVHAYGSKPIRYLYVSTLNSGSYNYDVEVVVSKDLKAVAEYARYYDSSVTEEEFKYCAGKTITTDECGTFVWLSDSTPANAAHEFFHVTYRVLDRAGVYLLSQTNEVYAYQLDNYLTQFYKQKQK